MEENYQTDFHDLFFHVESCLHNVPIYRQEWTRMAPAPNGPVKRSTPKVFTKLNPSLKCRWNGPGSPSDRRATRARAPHDPPMRGGPEQGEAEAPAAR